MAGASIGARCLDLASGVAALDLLVTPERFTLTGVDCHAAGLDGTLRSTAAMPHEAVAAIGQAPRGQA